MNRPNQESRRPTFEVMVVNGEGRNARWQKVGAAWPHRDGEGYNVELEALPINGRLVLIKPKPKAEEAPPAPQGQDVPFSA